MPDRINVYVCPGCDTPSLWPGTCVEFSTLKTDPHYGHDSVQTRVRKVYVDVDSLSQVQQSAEVPDQDS